MLMSEEQSSEHEHEPEPEPEPVPEAPPPVRIEVQFNVDGKAVGPNVAKYASRLGKLTRQHCPPHYSKWTLVPVEAINLLWNGILVANDPANPPSRTDIFVVTHTRKNGTFVSEEVRQKMIKINEIVARDPSSKHKDLDHDPVAEVFRNDGRGTRLG
ncbi:hypothetical protein IFM89_012689 [Coptis chinensis]|uniref:Uncharacterized protein n=1 Tax=Coptis chinensis TaxID=261450 RepID=A0A835LEY4_9MAGN|nr:hypothetical protein IFM89_012689 [Coptis chinensis]